MPGLTFQSVGAAWGWWLGELAALVPARLFPARGGSSAHVHIHAFADRTEIDRESDGVVDHYVETRALTDLDEEAWTQIADLTAGRSVTVLLGPPRIYLTTVALPRQARGRLNRAIELQLPEISPADPATIRWAIGEVRRVDDRILVPVILVHDIALTAIEDLFVSHDLPVPRIAAAVDDGPPVPISQAPTRLGSWLRRTWLAAALLVASIPLTTLFLSSLLIWSNQSALDVVSDAADTNVRQDRLIRRHEATRLALVPLARQVAVAQILDDLADRLPDGVSLLSAEGDGRKGITLTLVATDPQLVRDALDRDPFVRFRETDEVPRDDGLMLLSYRGTIR